jgi:hypothetical protein
MFIAGNQLKFVKFKNLNIFFFRKINALERDFVDFKYLNLRPTQTSQQNSSFSSNNQHIGSTILNSDVFQNFSR